MVPRSTIVQEQASTLPVPLAHKRPRVARRAGVDAPKAVGPIAEILRTKAIAFEYRLKRQGSLVGIERFIETLPAHGFKNHGRDLAHAERGGMRAVERLVIAPERRKVNRLAAIGRCLGADGFVISHDIDATQATDERGGRRTRQAPGA